MALSLKLEHIYKEVYPIMKRKYEEAKINEARDTPTIQVLDPASKPFKKYKPKRLMIVLFSSFMCFIINTIIIVTREKYKI